MTIQEYCADSWRLFLASISGVALFAVVDVLVKYWAFSKIGIDLTADNIDIRQFQEVAIENSAIYIYLFIHWLSYIAFAFYLDNKFFHKAADIVEIAKNTAKNIIPVLIMLFISTFITAGMVLLLWIILQQSILAIIALLTVLSYVIYKFFLLFPAAIYENSFNAWRNCWQLSKKEQYFIEFIRANVVIMAAIVVLIVFIALVQSILTSHVAYIVGSLAGTSVFTFIYIVIYRLYRLLDEDVSKKLI